MSNALKKCPLCNTYFFSQKDLESHMKTHWRPASNGKGEWMPAEAYPYLKKLLMIVGTMVKEGYRYTLIDNRIIYRVKINQNSLY